MNNARPRFTDPAAVLVFDKFINHLNYWTVKNNEESAYLKDRPLPAYDRELFFGEYGNTYIILDSKDMEEGVRTIVINAYDGDDGGASTLFAGFHIFPWGREAEWELKFVIHEFDTMPNTIWEDGKYVREDWKMETDDQPHTAPVEVQHEVPLLARTRARPTQPRGKDYLHPHLRRTLSDLRDHFLHIRGRRLKWPGRS